MCNLTVFYPNDDYEVVQISPNDLMLAVTTANVNARNPRSNVETVDLGDGDALVVSQRGHILFRDAEANTSLPIPRMVIAHAIMEA